MANDMEIVSSHMMNQPIDLPGVFAALNIDYSEQPIPTGESGWIEYVDGLFNVVINSTESLQRKRFTAAHELGHYLLHRDLLISSGRLNRHTDILFGANAINNETNPFSRQQEIEANKAAAEILMPASHIRHWHEQGHRVDALKDFFKVSKQAMEIRFNSLGLPEA